MIGASQGEVRLGDTDFEIATDLERSLLLIGSFAPGLNVEFDRLLETHLRVSFIYFIRKYDMFPIIDSVRLHLFDLAAQFPAVGGNFALEAAALGEWDLFGRLVMTLDEAFVSGGDDVGQQRMRRKLDWRGWTPKIMQELSKINENLPWAVCQIGTKYAGASRRDTISYKAMGPDLANAMTS
jgi:hypothetical protein